MQTGNFLIAIWLLSCSFAQAETLLIECTLLEQRGKEMQMLGSPRFVVESGKEATMQIGDAMRMLELHFTPQLLTDEIVEVRAQVIETIGETPQILGTPEWSAPLNKATENPAGRMILRTKISVVK
jgi:hypothetical protein